MAQAQEHKKHMKKEKGTGAGVGVLMQDTRGSRVKMKNCDRHCKLWSEMRINLAG